jgi:hypothetical protein
MIRYKTIPPSLVADSVALASHSSAKAELDNSIAAAIVKFPLMKIGGATRDQAGWTCSGG